MSKSSFKPNDKATAGLVARPGCEDNFSVGGIFTMTCFDADGNEKWVEKGHNVFTTEGIDHVVDVVFGATAADATLYVGLMDDGGAVVAGETLVTIAAGSNNATEITISVTSGDRQEWVDDAAGSVAGVLGNGDSVASFAIDASDTVGGAFLTNASTGTSGKLLCGYEFTNRAVASGDTLTVDYTITAADS